jgi:hypothetical protein
MRNSLPGRSSARPRSRATSAAILSKLDLCDRVQAVVFAYETGLIAPGGDAYQGLSGDFVLGGRGSSWRGRADRGDQGRHAPVVPVVCGLNWPAVMKRRGQFLGLLPMNMTFRCLRLDNYPSEA